MTDVYEPERPTVGFTEEPKKRSIATLATVGLSVAAAGLLIAAGALWVSTDQVDGAHKKQHAAEAALKVAEAKPPTVITRTTKETRIVPTYGRSVLMGVYASGAIQQGVYDGSGNMTMTPSDATCSMQYTSLSNQYTAVSIDRPSFMTACEASLASTLKRDTAP